MNTSDTTMIDSTRSSSMYTHDEEDDDIMVISMRTFSADGDDDEKGAASKTTMLNESLDELDDTIASIETLSDFDDLSLKSFTETPSSTSGEEQTSSNEVINSEKPVNFEDQSGNKEPNEINELTSIQETTRVVEPTRIEASAKIEEQAGVKERISVEKLAVSKEATRIEEPAARSVEEQIRVVEEPANIEELTVNKDPAVIDDRIIIQEKTRLEEQINIKKPSSIKERVSSEEETVNNEHQRVLIITNSDWSRQDPKIVRFLCKSLIANPNEIDSLEISQIFSDTLYVKCKLSINFDAILKSHGSGCGSEDRLNFLPACNTHTLVIKQPISSIDSLRKLFSHLLSESAVEFEPIGETCLIAKLETQSKCDLVMSRKPHSIDGKHDLIVEYLYNSQLLDQPMIQSSVLFKETEETMLMSQPCMSSTVIMPKLEVSIDITASQSSILSELESAWSQITTRLGQLSARASLDRAAPRIQIESTKDHTEDKDNLSEWSDQVRHIVDQILSQLVSKQVKFKFDQLLALRFDKERLRVQETDDKCCLLTGFQKDVNELINLAEEVENSRITQVTLDGFVAHQLKMLLRCKFIASMINKHHITADQIKFDIKAGSVTIRGTIKQVKLVREEMKAMIGSIVQKELKQFDPLVIRFITERESDVVEWLISHKHQCVLSADVNTCVLRIYSMRQEDADKCVHDLKSAIQCQTVDRGLLKRIDDEDILEFLTEVTDSYSSPIFNYQTTSSTDKELKLCGFEDQLKSIGERFIEKFAI